MSSYRISHTENGISRTAENSSTETHKSFPIHYGQREKILKRTFTHLYCIKQNEIFMLFSYTKTCFLFKKDKNKNTDLYIG